MRNFIRIAVFLLILNPYVLHAQKVAFDSANTSSKKTNDDDKFKQINDKIENNRVELNTALTNNKQDTKDILNAYVYCICCILGLIGFSINFFGKNAIKKRVEEIISETAIKQVDAKILALLNSKVTNELIKEFIKEKSEVELNKILESIENKGNKTIDNIKEKGYHAINTLLAPPTRSKDNSTSSDPTDEEITKNKDVARADELFNMAYTSKNPRVSIELYKIVIEIEPKNYNAYNNLGVHYNDINQYSEAIEMLNKTIQLNPSLYSGYSNRANSYNQLDQLDLALLDAKKAIELNAKDEFAYAVTGNIYTKQNKFLEAEESLDTAVTLNPESPDAYFNRGYFYEERKLFQKSEEDYLKAGQLGMVNKAKLYNNMAVLFRRQKKFNKAIEYIQKAREEDPNLPNLDGTLALTYADQGKEDEFYIYIKSALEKGCPVWNYLGDYGFDNYRGKERFKQLMEPYRNVAIKI